VEVALGPQRDGVVCIVRDITERHLAQAALKKANDELEARVLERTQALAEANEALARSNRELQDFAYVASHDLQEPLRKIRTFGERLDSQLKDTLDPQSKDYLERMQNAAVRMQRLIEDLLTFSRVTTRAEPFARVSLDAILRDVLSDLEVSIENARARIETAFTLGEVKGDATQLRQLLQNLIGNALKFRDGSRPHVVRITGERKDNERYELSVQDNGIGFEPRFSERIFGLFQRLHGRDHYEGSGVGLAICKKIAERHGGSISASGRSGEGSIFKVVLPCES
jgi:light-regulated signal transduction histidine kinase (bacteriophytochrome)